jgi:hypothetical protein
MIYDEMTKKVPMAVTIPPLIVIINGHMHIYCYLKGMQDLELFPILFSYEYRKKTKWHYYAQIYVARF